MSSQTQSVYRLGADDGLILGPLLTVTVVLIGVATYVPWVFLPALLCMIAVPVLTYYILARAHRTHHIDASFSALWLHGICMFFFGGLITAAITFCLLRWVDPGFIMHQIDTVIRIYGNIDDPQAAAVAETFEHLKKTGPIPSPLDMMLELLYFTVFSGSILSMFFAFLIRRRHRRQGPPPIYKN